MANQIEIIHWCFELILVFSLSYLFVEDKQITFQDTFLNSSSHNHKRTKKTLQLTGNQ